VDGRALAAPDCGSRLLRYLPGIYARDPFLGRFLLIFENIWAPLERQLNQRHAYFDPRLTPAELLPWLGRWLDLVLDENWPEERRRTLIGRAAELYERRGTAWSLREYLGICTGVLPQVLEDGASGDPFHFTVLFRVDDPGSLDEDRVRRIIEEEKPAHTTYTLRVEER
jgi:phage tail-like protein